LVVFLEVYQKFKKNFVVTKAGFINLKNKIPPTTSRLGECCSKSLKFELGNFKSTFSLQYYKISFNLKGNLSPNHNNL